MGSTTAPKSIAPSAEMGTTGGPARLVRPSAPTPFINAPQLRGNPTLLNTPTVASPNSTNTATAPAASINPQRYLGNQQITEDQYQAVLKNPIARMIAR